MPILAVAVLLGLFAAGVLWYHLPMERLPRAAAALCWTIFVVACAVEFVRRQDWRALTALSPPLALIVTWFIFIAPSNDRLWSPEMARTLTYTQERDFITLKNVRNFEWESPTKAREHWETRRYDLRKLKGLDVASLYWKGPSVAHTYFSFVWEDGEALSFSIEIRKERNETYSPVAGFFKAYERAILAGDERDFYGWRIYFPPEDIQLFHTHATPAEARKLLLAFLGEANKLAGEPAFYNTLTANCTTEIWMLTEAMNRGRPLDTRMFASGYLPEFLYDQNIIDTALPVAKLRERAHIIPAARDAIATGLRGAEFSRALRHNLPDLGPGICDPAKPLCGPTPTP